MTKPALFPIVIALHSHLQRYGVTAILQAGVIKCTKGAVHLERDIQSLLDNLADLTEPDAAARVVAAAVLQEMGIENDVLAEGLAQAGARP